MRIAFAALMLFPAVALADPSHGCLHQPESCLTEFLGEPTERVSEPTIMQYEELRQRVGKYADVSKAAIAKNGGYVIDGPDGAPSEGQEILMFEQPYIYPSNGVPFKWACTVKATTKDAQIISTGIDCPGHPTCVTGFVRHVLAKLAEGDVSEECKL